MSIESTDTVVVGGGQAGLAMSEHLSSHGVPHVVLERDRVAERWRSARWDSLVTNGPAWHDRFPGLTFDSDPDGFPSKEEVADYFVAYARQIEAPVRCGVEVREVRHHVGRLGFRVDTSDGILDARSVVAATGPFQCPVIPPVVPDHVEVLQLHSMSYRNPRQLPDGAVLVVGAGSSGVQIADELLPLGQAGVPVGRTARPASPQLPRPGLRVVAGGAPEMGRPGSRAGVGACDDLGQRSPRRTHCGLPAPGRRRHRAGRDDPVLR